jgi:hypothetical protein
VSSPVYTMIEDGELPPVEGFAATYLCCAAEGFFAMVAEDEA